mgnify:FL=1
MKKMIRTICVVAIALFAIPQQADAQFFKKLKKAAENVVKETITGETATESNSTATTKAPAMNFVTGTSGVNVGNPASKHFDVEFVEAIGNAASNTVTITLKATSKDLNYNDVTMGKWNVKAYDGDGNEYECSGFSDKKNMPAGIPVKFELAKIAKVPATVTMFSLVYVDYIVDINGIRSYDNDLSTFIQLKNVPITWQ